MHRGAAPDGGRRPAHDLRCPVHLEGGQLPEVVAGEPTVWTHGGIGRLQGFRGQPAEGVPNVARCATDLGSNVAMGDIAHPAASSAGAWGAAPRQGQVCMTAGRHIVVEQVADEYLDRLAKRAGNLPVGDPNTEQVALGPLINEHQDRIVTETVSAGPRSARVAPTSGCSTSPPCWPG